MPLQDCMEKCKVEPIQPHLFSAFIIADVIADNESLAHAPISNPKHLATRVLLILALAEHKPLHRIGKPFFLI